MGLYLLQVWWIPDPALQYRDNPQQKRKLLKKPAITPEDCRLLKWHITKVTYSFHALPSTLAENFKARLCNSSTPSYSQGYSEIRLQQIRQSICCLLLLNTETCTWVGHEGREKTQQVGFVLLPVTVIKGGALFRY